MINSSPVGRPGTPDEVASVAALLMTQGGALITGCDILIDGGVTASFFRGIDYASLKRALQFNANLVSRNGKYQT